MAYLAKVIRGADTDDKDLTPESRGVEALLDGVRALHYPNDHDSGGTRSTNGEPFPTPQLNAA